MFDQFNYGNMDGQYSGFGAITQDDLNSLRKALEAGYLQINQTGGSALRVESLESTLKVTTFNSKHIAFWKKIDKTPAYSTVEEWNDLSNYGTENSPFVREGELSTETDATYNRRTQLIKFMQTTRSVTHPMTLVHPAHGDVISRETANGVNWILRGVEKFLFSGDSSLAFSGEAEQFDGLDAQITAAMAIDLEGAPLQEADIEEASNLVFEAPNYGQPTDLFLSPRAASDLIKTMYPRERVNLPAPTEGVVGMNIKTVSTGAGDIDLNRDVFLDRAQLRGNPPSAASHAYAPATPASVTGAAAGTDADFTKSQGSTTNYNYDYAVTACNRFGESAPVFSANITMSAANALLGCHIALTITNAAVIGAHPPEYFRVYRTVHRGTGLVATTTVTDFALIYQVAASSQTAGGTTTTNDLNYYLPFTEIAYIGELTPSVLTFRQLAPLMKMDLAVISPAYRWMIMLYGTPILFAPRKWVRLINVGR